MPENLIQEIEKLHPNENDIIIFRVNMDDLERDESHELIKGINSFFVKTYNNIEGTPNITCLFLPMEPLLSIEVIDEKHMNELGWYKK